MFTDMASRSHPGHHEYLKFFGKAPGMMVLILHPDMTTYAPDLPLTHRNGIIVILPGEFSGNQLLLVDPVRHVSLEQLGQLSDALLSPQRYQQMDMLFGTANTPDSDPLAPGSGNDMIKNRRSDGVLQAGPPIPGRPDHVDPDLEKGQALTCRLTKAYVHEGIHA